MLTQSKIPLRCIHHTVVIRNGSLEDKFPGGFDAFRQTYRPNYNNHIAAYCVTNYSILEAIKALELIGLDHGKDFTTIDIAAFEMWRMIHSDKINQALWFEAGADWLKYGHWNGKIFIWYKG